MISAEKHYNNIMFSICHEHLTIGTGYSEETKNWNLRDMVSEMQYTLDLWNDPGSVAYDDAHDDTQPPDKPWYKNWLNEKARMKRFINKYKDEIADMTCTEAHYSKYD